MSLLVAVMILISHLGIIDLSASFADLKKLNDYLVHYKNELGSRVLHNGFIDAEFLKELITKVLEHFDPHQTYIQYM